MPELYAQEAAAVLETLPEPAFLVRGERIVYRNAAASRVTGDAPSIAAFLSPEALAACGGAAAEVPIELAGQTYDAFVRPQDGCRLIVARPRPDYEFLDFDVLSAVGQTLRQDLAALWDAASVLLPLLEEQEDPQVRRQTARVSQGLHRLARLAGNLTDLAGYQDGSAPGCLTTTDLCAFLEGLCGRIRPLARLVQVELELRCPPQAVTAAVDRQKLERALLNLVSNALRYTPAGGLLLLRLEDFGHAAHITLTDNGAGMAPSDLATAFNRYAHHGPQPDDARWGVGLGLSLVRAVAALHGGTVMLNAEEGRGTSVTLSLSRRLQPSPAEALRSPIASYDYAGSADHGLLELSDALPPDAFF